MQELKIIEAIGVRW